MVFEERDPFYEMDRFYRRLHRMMRNAWEPMRGSWDRFREDWRFDSFPVDLKDTDGELILNADLPGFEKDDIRIQVTADNIEIAARKKREKKEITESVYRRERAMGAVRRAMTLPVTVDPDSVSAEFKNGVLTVRMKKKEAKRGKKVEIK